jgi:hypothetical protein
MSSSNIDNIICEICGQKAIAGILDNADKYNQIKVRYSCFDHYQQIYQKIKEEDKKK